MRRVGIGYRGPLARWIDSHPPEIDCLEVVAEHFFSGGADRLERLAAIYPLFVHSIGVSLGTPGPLDRDALDALHRVVETARPEWVSEHVAFTASDHVDLGHLNPIAPTHEMLSIVADHASELRERCGVPVLLENITTHLLLPGDMSEPEFLNRLCERSGCRLLLDVTNLYINSRNHRFDPRQWLSEIDPTNVTQLHVVGYSMSGGRWEDFHAEPIQDDLQELIVDVVRYADPSVIVLERDENFPRVDELAAELRVLQAVFKDHASERSSRAAS